MDDLRLREVETFGRKLLWEKLNLGQCSMFEIPRAIGRATATMFSLSLSLSLSV